MSEEQIVAQRKRDAIPTDEIGADRERLGEALRPRLLGIREPDAPLRAVTEQTHELLAILRRRDHEDVADAGQHQRRERIIDHWLVVDREQLFAQAPRDRIEPGAAASGEHDPLQHRRVSTGISKRSRQRSSDCRQGGSLVPNSRSILAQSSRELAGRRAALGYCALGIATRSGTRAPVCLENGAKTADASPYHVVSPPAARW